MGTCRIQQGIFDRWFLVHPDDDALAWSGSRWVQHDGGIPVGGVQVSNFFTRDEARGYANAIGFQVVEPPV
jgi:hypothetical protein